MWNVRDERIPWVKKLGRIIGNPETDHSAEALVESDLFGFVDTFDVTHWQHVNRVSIVDLVTSRSSVASMDEVERDAKVSDVLALYDDYGRGMDGMELPYRAFCYKAVVADRRTPTPNADGEADAADADSPTPPPADGDTGEFLLIDFR